MVPIWALLFLAVSVLGADPAYCDCAVCNDENPLPPDDGRIRIAAVGDSITRGHPLRGSDLQYNYPCRLQRMLGEDKYVVFNFGAGGHTMMKATGNVSYWNSTQFVKAKACNPKHVLIMLGTNDAVQSYWEAYNATYAPDYLEMIGIFKTLPSAPVVQAMTCTPMYNAHFAGIDQNITNHVLPVLVPQIAAKAGLTTPIDVFNGMGGVNLTHHDWFWGNGSYGCHPNKAGYAGLSEIVYKGIHL
eukprot:Sspe_Gene.114101::Locus_99365_Transcript_1_1_Confidence_1.000_Length_854::g.114101::m.114101